MPIPHYILIVMFVLPYFGNNRGISFQEFNSLESCTAAENVVLAMMPYETLAKCLEK
jgi:ABC-type ATPase involved in cell division